MTDSMVDTDGGAKRQATARAVTQADADTAADTDADARALLDFLRDRDVTCPLCRYNLRALTTPRCPECGRELRLSVGLVEPRQGAWLTTQIATAAAAGIGFIAIISIMMHGWPEVRRNQWVFNISFAYYLTAIPLAAATFFLRRRYLRAAENVQRLIAVAAAIATAASLVAVVFTD
jgi:hypothetical protein